ncbi:MAG TPA: toll/interleukin-1 receptor domain-containing protein [Kofleriaceae bacterium]
MAYVPGWQNDVFVSYAHVDDQPLPGARDGWVSLLGDALKTFLAMQLGRAEVLAVWRDRQLTGHTQLTPEILTAARNSATLLIVLSEGYLASDWCWSEYREFVKLAGAGTRRLFVVERMPIERGRKPEELRDLLGYPFWVRDHSDGPARTLGVPVPRPDEPEYYHRLNRLALELAGELRRIKLQREEQHHLNIRQDGMESINDQSIRT